MRTAIGIVAAIAVATALGLFVLGGGGGDSRGSAAQPGEPKVDVISPRNGSRHGARSVVVKVRVSNFKLAPRSFGGEPRLREGHIRFSLNKVPNCVDPVKLARAEESPLGRGRLVGKSFDFPRYSGPNGILAERIGSTGSYSPATRPEIFYRDLPTGFYRLVIALARNDGSPTPQNTVTNFEILPAPGKPGPVCRGGKVSSAKAAAFDR